MYKMDITGRIRRTFRCQLKHFCKRILELIRPELFFRFPRLVTCLWFISRNGHFPCFNHPRGLDELLMALNLRAFNDEKAKSIRIKCTDKYAVREYVKERGFDYILNECYGVFSSVEEIDFESFPNQFVLKLTNGSGQVLLCRDKKNLNLEFIRSELQEWLNNAVTFGLKTGEWHYSMIQPRIIAEKFLSPLGDSISLIDYKFHCFNGRILGILVCYDRDSESHQVNYDWYDTEWNLTDGIGPELHLHQRLIPKPASYDEMCRIAKGLSTGINYVRIDLYEINGVPVFGEMTFTENGNIMETEYNSWVSQAMFQELAQS